MASPKVVLWRPMYDPAGHDMLREAGADVVIVDTPDADQLKQALHGARALWVRTPERVTADILDAGQHLAVVSTSGFGTDNIDIPAATERGILVVNHLGFGRIPVSEHSILMILAAAKRLVWGDRVTRDGTGWAQRSGVSYFELEGKTVGIVGLGYIGSELARKLKYGFRCNVLGYDPYVDARITSLADVTVMPDLYDMLAQSQVLVLVPELTDETRNMICEKELAALPKGAIVVNTGRGQVLDINALIPALDSGHVAAAGLDVVYPEPLPDGHPLLSHPAVTLSPHIAGGTVEATRALAQSACDQITTALKGELPRFPLNRQAWDGARSRKPGAPLI
ncbi:MAG: dehydrogenase [Alphaproteobacteria bacterium]|nr:dehydrogenase [Alphaproteobacteria bacterium]